MRTLALFVLVAVTVMTTACPQSMPKKPSIVTQKLAEYQVKQFSLELHSYECAANGQLYNTESKTFEKCGGGTPDLQVARRIRNDLIYRLIRLVDYNYYQFENDLYFKRTSGSFLADITDHGASFAATITNGERAKSIINTALIAFRGGRKSGSLRYFQEQTADVLIAKMQTARDRVLADMLQQLRKEDVIAYPLEAALGDTIEYFFAGTLPRALQELKKDAGIAAQVAQNNVRDAKGLANRALGTKEQRVEFVQAERVLSKLSFTLDSKNEKQRDSALARLQEIVKELTKNEKLHGELAGNEITSENRDGKKILAALRQIRKEKEADLDVVALIAINAAIVRHGSGPEGEED